MSDTPQSTTAQPGQKKRTKLNNSNLIPGNVHRLTDKQKIFISEYEKDYNGRRAAEVAGYSIPAVSACELLDPDKYPLVAEAIRKMMEIKRATCQIDARRIVQELISIALFNPRRLLKPNKEDGSSGGMYALHELPEEVCAAVSSMEVAYSESPDEEGEFTRMKHISLRFHSKMDALKQLALHLGLLKEVDPGAINVNIQNNNVTSTGPEGTTVTQTTQQVVIDWDVLRRPKAAGEALSNDPIEGMILDVAHTAHSRPASAGQPGTEGKG